MYMLMSYNSYYQYKASAKAAKINKPSLKYMLWIYRSDNDPVSAQTKHMKPVLILHNSMYFDSTQQ